ncbi:MAG: cytochrome c oxidase subunit II, partial [Solirubrobacterales bacterium]|nr:cytochrome c oxidase subunit II [Solirubrobacterales bacterium]
MRNRPILQMVVIGVIACAIGIPVALIIPWFPSKGSIQAGNVRTLYDVLLIATVPIFVLVETVVLFSVWKFHMRPGEEDKDGPPIHGNTRLEVIWTAVPAVLIISMCTYAYTVLRSNEASKANAMTVNVTARQFAFEFSYPEGPGKQVVSSELYLPKGQPVLFKIRSLDVVHSFFVPNFSEKIDAVPGIATSLRVTPTSLGTFPVECTELCGPGHSLMRSAAHVLTPAAFQAWLRSQPVNGPPPVGVPPANAAQPGIPGAGTAPPSSSSSSSSAAATTPAAGKAVFTGSAGCSSCHTLAAAGATGTVGPNLDQRLRSD